ncbi:MAG TPA: tetratricopeptide repeat protein [Rhodopila sp.]
MTELKLAGRPADLFDLGNTLLERGQAGAAIDAFKRSLALAPNHAASLYNLGNALLQAGTPQVSVAHDMSGLGSTRSVR